MAEFDDRFVDAGAVQRIDHQRDDFGVRLGVVRTEQFRTGQQRHARFEHAGGVRVHDGAGITESSGAVAAQARGIDARGLRRHVGADAQHAAAALIDHAKRLQFEIVTRTDEQRIEKFDQRRLDVLVAPRDEQIEHAPAELLERPCIGRQHLIDSVRKTPRVSIQGNSVLRLK